MGVLPAPIRVAMRDTNVLCPNEKDTNILASSLVKDPSQFISVFDNSTQVGFRLTNHRQNPPVKFICKVWIHDLERKRKGTLRVLFDFAFFVLLWFVFGVIGKHCKS